MIKNIRQYGAAKYQIAKLTKALGVSRANPIEMDTRIYKAMLAGIESQIVDIQKEMDEYDELGKTKRVPVDSFYNAGQSLIRARIARGRSQKDLAIDLGVKPQQIQKWEATEYRSVKLETLEKVLAALNFNASIMLATNEDWMAVLSSSSLWDISDSKADDLAPVEVSYGSEWLAFKGNRRAFWTFIKAA